jgi:hypothetical protein
VSYSAPAPVYISASKAPLMYPNPANKFVRIAQGEEPMKWINVYNIVGKLVVKLGNVTNSLVDMPVYQLPDGMYIVEIKTANSIYRQKLIVHN